MGDAPTDAQQSPDYGGQDFGEERKLFFSGKSHHHWPALAA
jgi:hypothetical protein